MTGCELCPRRCGVDRKTGQRGFCRAGAEVEAYRYGPHLGEEPPLSGQCGSGTIFFSRCTLACIYCQNYPWSQEGAGAAMAGVALDDAFRELAGQGCHNWNLVSPTPWLPQIAESLERLKRAAIELPVVYNTSGFERVEVLSAFAGLAAIYLPDLRYAGAESAAAGSGREDYPAVARAALKEMWRQVGPLRLNAEGIAQSGVICRVLVLPGHADEAVENLQWLASTFGSGMAVSVMAQYLPAWRALAQPPWDRRITRGEYDTVLKALESLEFDYGWVQDFEGETDSGLIGFKMETKDEWSQ